ncbi:MAG: cyclic nucleotide-binding domain-containing protein, partial [Candidatus Wallbacteria bacterium]|nr:cyclic nucleotide-binding domain-containing protein [Candidatus Wallbacteria bacterium]
EHIDHPDDRLRRKLLRAIARLHTNLGRPDVVPWSRMRTRIVDELKYTFQTLQDREIIRTAFPGWLMEDTFAHDLFRSKDRLWSLLALSHDPGVIGPCRRSLEMGNPSQRSNALEVLDNTLEEPLKTPFLALLESRSPRETVAAGRRQFQLATVVPQTWLLQNLKGGAGWHRAVALDCIGLHRVRALTEHVKEAMKDPVMLVRETALWAAVRLMGTGATDLLREAGGDSEPMANRLTRWLRDLVLDPDSADKSTGGRALLTTLEEVVFMRHIPIFQGVAAEHLAALAELTEEVFAGPGQEIVQQGDPGDSMFLIVSGQVEVLVDGKRVGLLGPRECFGEMALIDGETRSATVKALESTDLLTLGHDEFHEFLEERSEVASNVLRILCQRIRLLNQQLVSPGAAAPAGGQAR